VRSFAAVLAALALSCSRPATQAPEPAAAPEASVLEVAATPASSAGDDSDAPRPTDVADASPDREGDSAVDAAADASRTKPAVTAWTPGHGEGFGDTHERLGAYHPPPGPARVRDGTPSVNGRLPPEIVQRIVRQNHERFLRCYKSALGRSPMLQGRVTTKFVIGRDGTVPRSADGGSDLPDAEVVQCVIRGFQTLKFPEPEEGIVTVVYPLFFNPGD
jgi:outer membrane biosynthesis protein TonB